MIRAGIGGWTYEPWRGTFYPPKLPHAQELGLCEPSAPGHRDQRHLLPHAKARHLPQMGRGDAGRLRVLGEGSALCGEQARARRGRPFDRALRRKRARTIGRQARPDPVAVRAHGRSSTRRISRPSLRCCRARRRGARLRHVLEVRHASFKTPAFYRIGGQGRGPRLLSRISKTIR